MTSTFPPPPVNTIDWDNIGFQVREGKPQSCNKSETKTLLTFRKVNGHVESVYSSKTGKWTTPKFVRDPFLRIHGMAPGLNYAMAAFEGLKALRGPGDTAINIFRPQANAERMQHSAAVIGAPEPPVELFKKAVHLAVSLNAEFVPPHRTGASVYIRPIVFGSSANLGLDPPEEYTFLVYVMPTGVYHGVRPVTALIVEDFDRAAPFGSGHAKLAGNYGPVVRHSAKAKKEGFGITLHLDSQTRSEIDEFSTAAFIGIIGSPDTGCTLVVPDSKNVIKSVTSDSAWNLAKSFGWNVEKRPIKYEDLPNFSEVIAAGTAASLVPVKSITLRSKNDLFKYQGGSDEPGPAFVKLITELKGLQQGKIKDTLGWLEPVREYQPDEYETDGTSQPQANGAEKTQVP